LFPCVGKNRATGSKKKKTDMARPKKRGRKRGPKKRMTAADSRRKGKRLIKKGEHGCFFGSEKPFGGKRGEKTKTHPPTTKTRPTPPLER